ncbi:MAG: hypothetical protein J6Y71_06935 [Ruminococcus sp.]|nr:hypothetical protein [Ruminococcus sp.]
MAKVETNVNILNGIREAASDNYRSLVPIATASNLQDVGNPILSYTPVRNEFLSLLVNKIALPIIKARRFRNPLAMLKREGSPLGYDEEEIGVNPATAKPFDAKSADLLAQETPDVKVAYHRMNRQDRYDCTIQFAVLRAGFMTWGGFDRLTDEIVQSLYNGNYIDEFAHTKKLIAAGVADGSMCTVPVAKPESEATAKAFVKAARTAFTNFQFPSTQYNSWARSGGAGAQYTAWSDKDRIMLFIRSDISTEVDVEVLARAFNLEATDLMGRVVIVPDFGDLEGAENIFTVMCDFDYPVIIDKLFTVEDFRNGSNLSTNYYLHVWQTYSTSPLNNAVAFVANSVPPVTLAPMLQSESIFEVSVADIQSADLAVGDGIVTGTSKYLSGDNAIVNVWGPGNFLALQYNADDWSEYEHVYIGLTNSAGSGLVDIKDDDTHTATAKITDKYSQELIIKAIKGGISKTWLYSLDNLTLEPESR